MDDDLVLRYDEIRRRSDMFWLRRYSGLWPIEAQGHTFLANAILSVGRVLFGDKWNDDIPRMSMLPIFHRHRPLVTDGFDATYAVGLLRQHRPGSLSSHTKVGPPLSPDEWKAAFEVYETYERARNAQANEWMFQHILPRMTVALADGALRAACRIGSEFRSVDPSAWIDERASYPRFLESQMNMEKPDVQQWPGIYEQLLSAHPRELLDGNSWIFLTRESLQGYLKALGAPADEGHSSQSPMTSLPEGHLKALVGKADQIISERSWITPTQDNMHEVLKEAIQPAGYFVSRGRMRDALPQSWPKKQGPRGQKLAPEQIEDLRHELSQELRRLLGRNSAGINPRINSA